MAVFLMAQLKKQRSKCLKLIKINYDLFAYLYRKRDQFVNQLLSGWFCFVQMEDGKIVAVQHAVNESESAVDVKKSIAAAFQTNFKGTESEEETDPQSDHIAHYR